MLEQTFLYSLHALLEDRVPPGLTDDQISPLDDDDADEEGSVARELHDLPLLISLTGNTHTHTPNLVNTGGHKLYLWSVRLTLLTHCCP